MLMNSFTHQVTPLFYFKLMYLPLFSLPSPAIGFNVESVTYKNLKFQGVI